MKRKRVLVLVLVLAFTAALAAAWIARSIVSGPREVQEVERTVGATDVLVASKNIGLGDSIGADGGRDPQNLPYPNLGCATQRNFAVAVANPQDLIGPRAETPRPGERRDVVWGKYVKGEPTISKRDPSEHANISDIGQIGGGQ